MGFLRKVFKKKEGGTVLGNIARSVGDKFTSGMVSTFFPKPTAADVQAQAQRWGDTSKTISLRGATMTTRNAAAVGLPPAGANTGTSSSDGNKTALIAGGALLLIGGVYFMSKRNKPSSVKRRRR